MSKVTHRKPLLLFWFMVLVWVLGTACAPTQPDVPFTSPTTPKQPFNPGVLPQSTQCQPASEAAQMFGLNASLPNRFAAHQQQGYLNQIVNLEARWVRTLYWNPNGGLNRTAFKTQLENLRKHGIRILVIVDHNSVPGWGSRLPDYHAADNTWKQYRQAYLGELGKAVKELASVVDAWQVMNEPNQEKVAGTMRGAINPKQFGLITKEAAALLHRDSKGALVVSAGLVNWRTGDASKDVNGPDYLQRVINAVGKLPVDILAFHAYGTLPPQDGGPEHGVHFSLDKLATRFQEQVNDWRAWRNKVSTRGQVKLWVTEFGGPLNAKNGPAKSHYLQEALRIGYQVWRQNTGNGIQRAFYFTMTDHGGFPDEDLGLLRHDLTPKNSYHQYDKLTKEEKACPLGTRGTTTDPKGDGTCPTWTCGNGKVCKQSRCVDPGTTTPTNPTKPDPKGDGTCPTWTCGNGKVCKQSRCVDPGTTTTNPTKPDPKGDGTCPTWTCGGGKVCRQSRCVNP